jgi:hypothetical protein
LGVAWFRRRACAQLLEMDSVKISFLHPADVNEWCAVKSEGTFSTATAVAVIETRRGKHEASIL